MESCRHAKLHALIKKQLWNWNNLCIYKSKHSKLANLLNAYFELIKYVISDYIPLTFLGTDFLPSP